MKKEKTYILIDGLALYKRGSGPVVFLMPYPHASTYRPAAEGRLADLLISTGLTVVSFDPPGFCNSTRVANADLNEMLECADECLDFFKISDPVLIIGHSMGSFCSMAYALKNPERVSALILAGSTSGWKAVRKHGIHNSYGVCTKGFWLSRYYGIRIILGWDNLAIHRKLDNLNSRASFFNPDYYEELPVLSSDRKKPSPPRAKWLAAVRKYDLLPELGKIKVPVLLITGIHDRVTPPVMAREIQSEIENSELHLFPKSGHSPFIEEPGEFKSIIEAFLQEL